MTTMKRVGVVFCGEPAVGKSSLIRRFSEGTFIGSTTGTIGGAFFSSYVRHDGQIVALELWDTAGSERYHSVIPSFFKNTAAVVIVFDVSNRPSFDQISFWQTFASAHAPPSARFVLVGNKVDLFGARAVEFEEAKSFADKSEFSGCMDTSAKTGEGIETLFAMLANIPTSEYINVDLDDAVVRPGGRKCC
jgi:small GTP-binding protein